MTTEIAFLTHTLSVLNTGDAELISEHAKTIQIRIDTLTTEAKIEDILADYQKRIDNRLLNLKGK